MPHLTFDKSLIFWLVVWLFQLCSFSCLQSLTPSSHPLTHLLPLLFSSPSFLASHIFDYSALCKNRDCSLHIFFALSLVGLTTLYLATFSLSLFFLLSSFLCSCLLCSSVPTNSLFCSFSPPLPSCLCFTSQVYHFLPFINTPSLYHSLLCVTGLIYFHFQFNGGSSTVFLYFQFTFYLVLYLTYSFDLLHLLLLQAQRINLLWRIIIIFSMALKANVMNKIKLSWCLICFLTLVVSRRWYGLDVVVSLQVLQPDAHMPFCVTWRF